MDELDAMSPPLSDALIHCARTLDGLLGPAWEIYVRPYLNGLNPDIVLLNPNVGVGIFHVVEQELAELKAPPDAVDLDADSDSASPHPSASVALQWLERAKLVKKEVLEIHLSALTHYGSDNFYAAAVSSGLIFTGLTGEQVSELFPRAVIDRRSGQEKHYIPISASDDLRSRQLVRIFPEGIRVRSSMMNEHAAQQLRSWLLAPEYRREQKTPLVLDARQREIANRRTQTGYQRIRGPAGSGKTAVLAAKAARLEAEGKRCLILVYNLTLVNYVKDVLERARLDRPRCEQSVDIMSFHAWCRRLCCQNGFLEQYKDLWSGGPEDKVRDGSGSNERVLNEGLARFVERILARAGKTAGFVGAGYDAVLVDEGQDFRLPWWNCARRAVTAEAELILCSDLTQDLYETARYWTNEAMDGAGFRGPWNELKVAYRLPEALVPFVREFAQTFLPRENSDLPEPRPYNLSLGHELRLRWVQTSEADLVSEAEKAILEMPLMSDPGDVSFSDVVLVADHRKTGAEIVSRIRRHGVDVFHTFRETEAESRKAKTGFFMNLCPVKATTIHSFKGLESRYLVICIHRARQPKELAALYIAMTRLKASDFGNSHLTVVCSEPRLKDYGTTWPS